MSPELMCCICSCPNPVHVQVNVTRAVVHSEEQEEGDMRPDLDTELHVSRVNVC